MKALARLALKEAGRSPRFFAFQEHPNGGAPGAYMIGADGGGKWGGSIAISIVDVESGGERGRAMTSIRF